jgi:hypothetical protein
LGQLAGRYVGVLAMSVSRTYRFLTLPEAVEYSGKPEEEIRAQCRVLQCHPTKEEFVGEKDLIEVFNLKR